MVNYWFDTFGHLNPFDIISYDKVIEMYDRNAKLLDGKGHESFGWNSKPINSKVDKLHKDKLWNGYEPKYYNIDPIGKKVVQAKADTYSMDMQGVGETWSHFIYLELPHKIINNHMTKMHDNDDVSVLRKFIRDVESTEKGWDEEDNWRTIESKYDELYPEKSQYEDFYEVHEKVIKWKMDFDILQYITLYQNGIIFPICYNSNYFMLRRGTHRAILLAMTGSDVPIFLQYPNMDLNTDITFKVDTPKFFGENSLVMTCDVKNKKLKFNIDGVEV